MITSRLTGDAELWRWLERLPGAAERRIAGTLARLCREWLAAARNEPSGDAKAHGSAPASSIAAVRADLRRMRRAFGRPMATARRDMRPPGRRVRLAGHALARVAPADLELAIRAEITDALHEALR